MPDAETFGIRAKEARKGEGSYAPQSVARNVSPLHIVPIARFYKFARRLAFRGRSYLRHATPNIAAFGLVFGGLRHDLRRITGTHATGAGGRGLAAPACKSQATPMLTALSCRALADEDRARASNADLANQSERLRASADAWDVRAELLERIGQLSLRRASARD